MKAIIKEDIFYFPKYQLVEGELQGDVLNVEGVKVSKNNLILITEKLTKADEDVIRKMVKELLKDKLKLMFWRLWTRSSFITK